MKTFGQYLAEYRQRLGMSQQELSVVGLHPSDISKLERDTRKAPRLEIVQRMVEVLRLTHSDTIKLLDAAGYSPSVLNNAKFDPSVYPPTTKELANARLQGDRGYWPAWLLDTNATIIAANLLSFSLWQALPAHQEEFDKSSLLGRNVFEIVCQPKNMKRIAMPHRTTDSWSTKILVYRKLEENLPSSVVANFKEVILNHPILRLIYEYASLELDEEWSYCLKILSSQSVVNLENQDEYLQFEVYVERIIENNEHLGYIVTYQPLKKLIKLIEKEYQQLLDLYGKEEFVQYQGIDSMDKVKKYPTFYPSFHQDYLWYLIEENHAHELLAGKSYQGQHFFDLFLPGPIRDKLGVSLANTAGRRAMKWFFILTAPYQKQDPPRHAQYEMLMQRLLAIPEFREMFEEFWMTVKPFDLAEIPQEGVPSYAMEMDGLYSASPLSFDSVPHFLRKQLPEYYVTLVPRNDETKASLILLHLEDTIAIPEDTELAQLLWGLAVVKTLKEGITIELSEAEWEPVDTFRRILNELKDVFHHPTETTLKDITLQMKRAVIELILQSADTSKQQ